MIEEQIEVLIDAIESYNTEDPYIILLYIPYSDDDEYYDFDFFFAVLSAKREPDKEEMESLIRVTKWDVGNMIYAADTLVMKRDDAIGYLTSLI